MTKALLKKQLLESFSWLFFNRKNGKSRGLGGIIGFSVLYLALFAMVGFFCYVTALSICEPLCSMNFGWLYFVVMGLFAVVLGVFGSVFNTYSSLYLSKDNDLLLAMPIPTSKILLMRLSGVYVIGLMYELIIMIPALIVWFIYAHISITGVIFSLIIPFVISIFILTLSCILGWVVAAIGSRIKIKSFVTVILSLLFIVFYYYVYFKAYQILQSFLTNAENIAQKVKGVLYPFYQMGLAAEGNIISMLIFTGIILAAFLIVYFVLSHSFLNLATVNKGSVRVKYKQKIQKQSNVETALLRKELKRFTASANYMLNCGLGIIIMPIAAIAVIIKGKALLPVLEGLNGALYLLIAAAVCTLSSMCDITAPSVSLEGKNIWLAQSLPVSPWQVLKSKLNLHLLLVFPPVILLAVSMLIVFNAPFEYAVAVLISVALFAALIAMLGLALNLISPNLSWTNETVPIKQSFSTVITIFASWAIIIVFAVLYIISAGFIPPILYLAAVCLLLTAVLAVLYMWLKNEGAKIFAGL